MRETTRFDRRTLRDASCRALAAGAGRGALVLLGRALFASLFLLTACGHFRAATVAAAAGEGLPLAGLLVPGSGLVMLAGGLGVLLGWRVRLGAWLLVAFLTPATFLFHDFWTTADPLVRHREQIAFMKNLSLLGGALVLTQLGAGPWSLDERRGRGAEAARAPGTAASAGDHST